MSDYEDLLAEAVDIAERRRDLKLAFSDLPRVEQEILSKRFGFNGQPQTYAQVGRDMHMVPQRVKRLETKALRWLSDVLP